MHRIKLVSAIIAVVATAAALSSTAAGSSCKCHLVVNLKAKGISVSEGTEIPVEWFAEPFALAECATVGTMQVAANDGPKVELVGHLERPFCHAFLGLSDYGEIDKVELTTGEVGKIDFSPPFVYEGYENSHEEGPFCAYELKKAAESWVSGDGEEEEGGAVLLGLEKVTATRLRKKSSSSCSSTSMYINGVTLHGKELLEEIVARR